MPIDLDNTEEMFAASTDLTVGLEEEFAVLDPRDAGPRPALRGAARRGGRARPGAARRDHRRADLLGDRDRLRPRRGPARRDRPPARPPPAAVHARRQPRRRARLDRHASVGRLPRAAQHRHRALPPRRRGPRLRRAAQQHVLAARPRRRARRRSRGGGLRSPAARAAAAAGGQRQLAVSRGPGHAAALRPQPDLHEVLSALRRARRVRRLAHVSRLPRAAHRDAARSSSTRRSGGRCARTPPSGPSRCASATRRSRPPSPRGWPRSIVACVGQALRDIDEGVPFDAPAAPARSRRTCGARSATAWTAT